MEKLFEEYSSFDKYKCILLEPLEADFIPNSNDYCHEQKCYVLTSDKIKHINRIALIKDNIECLFFVYVDFGQQIWDKKYWFFVGKLKNGIYFVYESGRSGTGFGFGETSQICLSKMPDVLCKYGLTDKQRDLIINNISKRFICPHM